MNSLTWALLIALAATPTGGGPRVEVDYDHQVDFARYTTFGWTEGDHVSDELGHFRITGAIELELGRRRMARDDEAPQLELAYYASSKTEVVVDSLAYAWRSDLLAGRNKSVRRYKIGTLVLDVIDAAEDRLIWRGTVSDVISPTPGKNTAKIQRAVEALFAEYPLAAAPEPAATSE